MKKTFLIVVSTLFIAVSCKQNPKPLNDEEYAKLTEDDRRKPENGISGFVLNDPELEVTLFASEPMMTNPTNMDIDAKGRVWICEGYNYRNQLNPKNPYKPAGDRILIMEDTDKDGKADKSTVFYQGTDINSALGISVLGNKVIVSCSPNVFIFTDTNGDDKADKKEILFTGIKGLQHDHAVHAFTFGPDGKLYFNYGNEGKGLLTKDSVAFKDDLGRVIDGSGKPYREGMVFRCNPDGSNLEVLGWNFRNNYEVAVDSYGRMWQSDNDDDGNKGTRINYVMDYGNYGYKDEMTGAGWRERRTNWEDEIPLRHWHLNDPGVVPNLVQTYAGSPTGILVYEGDLLPEKYRNQIIHCDAGPNVLRTYPATKSGAGFKAEAVNILDGSKRDQWFRPSDVTVAPDGSIFVSDWYDPGVGGHAMGDSTRGRIYRIAPKGHDYEVPTFDFETAEGAVEALQNPNLAVRYLAYQKLNELGAKAEEELTELWEESDNSRIRARALWLLGRINPAKYIDAGINDKDEDIRVTAIRLARESKIDIIPILKKLAIDASPQVRREVALALRHNTSPQAAEIWTKLATQHDGQDRWYLEALGIAADNQWDKFMPNYLAVAGDSWKISSKARDIVWRSRDSVNVFRLAELLKSSSGKDQLKYFRAFDFQSNPDKTKILLELLNGENVSTQLVYLVLNHADVSSIKRLPQFKTLIKRVLTEVEQPTQIFDMINRYGMEGQTEKLVGWALTYPDSSLGYEAAKLLIKHNGIAIFKKLAEGKDKKVAKDAIYIFGKIDTEDVTNYLISIFSNKSKDTELRAQAVKSMHGWDSEETLWKLIESGKFPKDMEEHAKPIMLGTWHGDIRGKAMKYFGGSTNTEEMNIAELLKAKGDIAKGSKVFESYCQTCHQVKGKGVSFGPALSEIGSKLTPQALYEAILYPSKGISFGYENHAVKLKDGSEVQGIVVSKTENEVTLKQMGGTETKYKRSDIKSMEELKESPMPTMGLAKNDLVDLVEYLKTLKK
ncbi:MAG: PVC-type heme-binding CxxCH protein [Spirosomataceae bacterium]